MRVVGLSQLRGILLGFSLLLVSPTGLAHEAGGGVELPEGGTLHELRITRLTSFTAAQGITQRVICDNPFRCFQDELHLSVIVNFATGEFVIDATELEDENEAPARVLFNTQSGPAEMIFAPPCDDPEGCVGGEAIYSGTIDEQGNITMERMGIVFEVFGILPLSEFQDAMSTGTIVEPDNPSFPAVGSALNFATGELALEGVAVVTAPIVGQILQINRIEAQIVPVPTPPIESKALIRCQKATEKAGAKFVKKKQKNLQKCANALLACEISDESGDPDPGCLAGALQKCTKAQAKIAADEVKLREKLAKRCDPTVVPLPNMLASIRGLGFGANQAQCEAIGIPLDSQSAVQECTAVWLECAVEELVGLLQPRAGEVLVANGLGGFVDPNGCMPVFASGDAAGTDAKTLTKCAKTLGKAGGKLIKTKQKQLQKCIDAQLACDLEEEAGELSESEHDACHVDAAARCSKAVSKISGAQAKFAAKVSDRCGAVPLADLTGLPLGLQPIVDRCAALTPPIPVSSVADLIDCLEAVVDCSVEGIVRKLKPRAADALEGVVIGPDALLDLFPCLVPSCGDGIVDAGEECDPLFDSASSCRPTCVLKACGDGILDSELGEECDDGNTKPFDGCSAVCLDEPFLCGNGALEAPFEICDDGDTHGGDGCSGDCQSDETCGNAVLDSLVGEVCDDGGFDAVIEGAQVVPPVVSAGGGSGSFTLNPDLSLDYMVFGSDLVSVSAAHIHRGAIGVSGPIIAPLSGGPSTWTGTTDPLSAEDLRALRAEELYVNIHTSANPDGEVRGQILFAAPLDGDGCSADCISDETCGNGVIDSVSGETCDDGNTAGGDGCDASCQFEACGFQSVGALGTRPFSIDPNVGGQFISLAPAGPPVGVIGFTSGPILLTAGGTDASGNAIVTLDSDVIIGIPTAGAGFTQCVKLEAAGTVGTLHCCGGFAVDMSFTRDSDTTNSNGPSVILTGIGTGGPGDLEIAFQVSQSGAPLGTPEDCADPNTTYGSASTRFWTSGTATGRVVRPIQDPTGVLEFPITGQSFDCSSWTTENAVGAIVNSDTALNAIPGILDLVNGRLFEDDGGN